MSKKPQTMANLKEAERIKQSPFKTKIHANPAMKQEIDAMLDKGIALRTIHRDMKKKYDEAMPSLSTFSNYVKVHYVPSNSVVVPKHGAEAIKDFDAMLKLRNEIEDIDNRIQKFAEKENVTGFPIETVRKYRELKVAALEKYITLGIKMGVIDSTLQPEFNNYGSVNNGTFIEATEPLDIDFFESEDYKMMEKMVLFREKEKKVAEIYARFEPDENDPNVEFSVIQTRPPELIKALQDLDIVYD